MKKIRVGINGMGRIGRTILRKILLKKLPELEVVAVNNPGRPISYIHLLEHDSIHGRFPHKFEYIDNCIKCQDLDKSIYFHNESRPENIAWDKQNVDIVIDSTGIFRTKEALSKHFRPTVKKVILCAPGKDVDGTFVMGINEKEYRPSEHHIISNASCTTNCLAPVCKILHDQFIIENGFMATVHAYTLDQSLLDSAHKDLRRARAAALNIIPTSTGAAKSIGLVIPELAGKLDGYAIRVPTPDVSLVDLTVNLGQKTSVEEINQSMLEASQTYFKNILYYNDEELVSSDFVGNEHSAIFDSTLIKVHGNTTNLVIWYDNEAGFSSRVIDLALMVGENF